MTDIYGDLTPQEVPPELASEIEQLIAGEGPFADIRETEFTRSEDINTDSDDDPQAEDDMEMDSALLAGRVAALEYALSLSTPIPEEPKVMPDQNVEFGKTIAGFTIGATITLDPCDIDGNDTGEDNVTVYLKSDKASIQTVIADETVLMWERFDVKSSADVNGILIGAGTSSGDGDTVNDIDNVRGDGCVVGSKDPGEAKWISVEDDGAFRRVRHCKPGECVYSVGVSGCLNARLVYAEQDAVGHVIKIGGFTDDTCAGSYCETGAGV